MPKHADPYLEYIINHKLPIIKEQFKKRHPFWNQVKIYKKSLRKNFTVPDEKI